MQGSTLEDIYDVLYYTFQIQKSFGLHGLDKNISALLGLYYSNISFRSYKYRTCFLMVYTFIIVLLDSDDSDEDEEEDDEWEDDD